nr:MAG TPA: portal [Caudoviricetes sp.]
MKQDSYKEDVVREIKQDFAARQKMRRPYELGWQLNMNFVMGNQYCQIGARGAIEQEDKFYFWQEKQVYNHIAPIVETRLSRLNRVRPRPLARPFSNTDSDVNSAKLATKILDSALEKTHLDEVISQATGWSEVCGTAFYKIVWDTTDSGNYGTASGLEDDKNGNVGGSGTYNGDVSVTACSPFEIYPDSNVAAGIADCASIIHAKVYPISEVARRWGVDVRGETVKVFNIDSAFGGVGGLGYNSTVPSVTQETKSGQVVVIERYTRPDSANPDGKLEIVVGDKLVYSGVLPYAIGDNGKRGLPFVRQISAEQVGCFWGASVVERIIPIQRAYNAVKNRKHEFLNRLAMGVLTVEDGSVDTDNLEEEGLSPGKILVYRQGADKPQIMDSGSVPSEFGDEEDRLLQEFVTVSGVSEFARNSSTPAGMTSGVALQLIAEQDNIRLASSIDSVKAAIKTVAKYVLRLYKQYVSYNRLMRYTDGQNSAEVFYFSGCDIGSDDIVFETENELTDTLATRRTMLFDLLNAGILSDKNGQLTVATKAKILSLMGFGNWENAQDTAQLHIARAEKENVDIDNAEVLEVDDHAIHIEEHTRFIIANELSTFGEGYREKLLAHIAEHKARQNEQA